MSSYKLYGAKDLRPDSSQAEMNQSQVLIKTHSVGICGSDIHYYMHGSCGNFIPKDPLTLGHEFSGVVEAVPENNRGIKVGDRVAVNPLLSCAKCHYCMSGQNSLCAKKKYMGSAAVYPHVQGALSKSVLAPVENVFVLPETVSFVQGAMIEPAAVALHAIKQSGDSQQGKKSLIIGGGAIGQLILRFAVLLGAKVDLSDPKPFCRETALKSGALAVIDPIAESLPDQSYDYIYEASGTEIGLNSALSAVKKGGVIVQVGTMADTISIPGNIIMSKEIKLVGSLQFGSEFAEVLKYMSSGDVNVEDLNTHRFPFKDSAKAIEYAAEAYDSIKVQIEVGL